MAVDPVLSGVVQLISRARVVLNLRDIAQRQQNRGTSPGPATIVNDSTIKNTVAATPVSPSGIHNVINRIFVIELARACVRIQRLNSKS